MLIHSFYKSLLQIKKNKRKSEFYVEGVRYIGERRPLFVVCSEDTREQGVEVAERHGTNLVLLSNPLFQNVSDSQHSQGLLAIYSRSDFCREIAEESTAGELDKSVVLHDNTRKLTESSDKRTDRDQAKHSDCEKEKRPMMVLVLDQVSDPGNMGAIIRSADAAGIQKVYLVKGSTDPYSPKATRSSAGSILNIDVVIGSREDILEELRAKGYVVYTADLNGQDYHLFREMRPFALVLGNEAHGVHSVFTEQAISAVTIPIYGGAESLNVSVAAGILIYGLRDRCTHS